jgi:hypothetical protein
MPASRWITWRSVLLGSLAVVLVCGLTPYNDFVVANTYFIGSYLPVALVLVFLVLIVLVNAPLHRLRPRWALTAGELAVIMAMMLVSCSIPSQGLMRSFIPTLVAPFHFAASDETFRRALAKLGLAPALFPVENVDTGNESWIVRYFYSRLPEGTAVPYGAWIGPLAAWGVFIGALWATLLALAVILRPQWATNERLPFPLAQVEASLIEPPRPGRSLNALLGSRVFWIGAVCVFGIESLIALHKYLPHLIPPVTLTYDVSSVMTEPPLFYFAAAIKRNTVHFTLVGAMFFVQTRVAFSVWSIYLILQTIGVAFQSQGAEIPGSAWHDQHLGACLAFLAGVIWIGRHHWGRIVRHAFVGLRAGERVPPDGTHRGAFFTAVGGLAIMLAWLVAMGVGPALALLIVGIILLAHLVVARIVAETGLPLVRVNPAAAQIYTLWPVSAFSGRDIFFAGVFTANGAFHTRESLLTYATHGLWVHDSTHPPAASRRGLVALLVWALVLGFGVGCVSSLWCYYNYITPIDRNATTILNNHGTENLPKLEIVDPMNRFTAGQFAPKRHDPALHLTLGAGITGLLQVGALRYSAWPFSPVGYIVSGQWFIHPTWFSVFLGWLCKVLVLRFGGATMFQKARPFFIGIIFGEALAIATWLVVNLILAALGQEYQAINFLPA